MSKPFSTKGEIIAVTLDHSNKELFVSVCRNPNNENEALLEASNGDTMSVAWERITFNRDLTSSEKRLKKGDLIQNREIIDVGNFPHDKNLQLVLCDWKDRSDNRFVVWQYNMEFGSFSFGHYFDDLEKATEKFKERIEYHGIK